MAQGTGAESRPVVVLGGGLAGIAAACELAAAGRRVQLVEKRPFLGGRAFSFPEPETGQEIDNGQHVFLGCCHAYIALLERLGVLGNTQLAARLDVPIYDRRGRRGRLRGARLPAPLHLVPSLLGYPHLGWLDRLRVLYGGACIQLIDRKRNAAALESETFADWLRRHGQSEAAIAEFWNLITLPTLNDDITDVSAAMGLMVFQEGVFASRASSGIGYAKVGLSQLVSAAASDFVGGRGGEVLLGTGIRAIRVDDGMVRGVETSSGLLRGEAYVSALPPDVLLPLLPPDLAGDEFFGRFDRITHAPIVALHVWYDRPVMDDALACFSGSSLQWVFNRTRMQEDSGEDGQYICVSISGAWEYARTPRSQIETELLAELAQVLPRARSAQVRRALVIKHPNATFRCLPGADRLRPPSQSPVRNLLLAGEWVQTGWPGTMEGAVRSGQSAARRLLREPS
ncbi:MAG: NAD(P)-binding protein [Chloroflexi bacterium]|nr:NAD(P)-binding protein [Chloroflexota bacterium]